MLGFSTITLLVPLVLTFLYPNFSSRNAINKLTAAEDTRKLDTARVLLVTAHPDDEVMFFAPTVLALSFAQQSDNVELYIACLSTGEMGGIPATRVLEFENSLDMLGVHASRRWILDKPQLRDDIAVVWEADAIAEAVGPIVDQNRITTILTFDEQGVSSHPNHCSLLAGLSKLLLPGGSVKHVFKLVSVPIHQKYLGPLAPIISKIDLVVSQSFLTITDTIASHILALMDVHKVPDSLSVAPVVFVSGWKAWWQGISAMRQHKSQLLWFRWFYLAASRYMWLNEWVEVTASS